MSGLFEISNGADMKSPRGYHVYRLLETIGEGKICVACLKGENFSGGYPDLRRSPEVNSGFQLRLRLRFNSTSPPARRTTVAGSGTACTICTTCRLPPV